jgi:CheY-like chemotaxis protein
MRIPAAVPVVKFGCLGPLRPVFSRDSVARILVVDDDSQLRSVVSRLLRSEGHEVTEAPGGEEASAAIKATAFDLLLIDLVMPEKGGLETIMEIHHDAKSIPTIVMSGKIPVDDDAVNRLVERYGARGVLAKPFTNRELLDAIDLALEL